MKAKKFIYILLLAMIGLTFVQCGKDDDKVTGPNTIDEVIVEEDNPVLIADGVSTANLTAVVNDTSGYPVSGIRVYFSTTYGSITASAVTNVWGEAYAVLTSVASVIDLPVQVTVSLLDSSSLHKKVSLPYKVTLKTPKKNSLKKTNRVQDETIRLNYQFVGVQYSATLNESVISADGINYAELDIVVKETTSKKAVTGAYVYLNALHNTIPQYLVTGNDGTAQINIASLTDAIDDTIYVNYGGFADVALPLSYVLPTMELMPQDAQISAGGQTDLVMTARLVSFKNNPIIGAQVVFTATDGSITALAVTNTRGDASATLVSGSDVNDHVKVLATFNSIKDSANVAFIETAGGEALFQLSGEDELLRNGMEAMQLQALVLDNQQNPVTNTKIRFSSLYGEIDSSAVTNENGIAEVTYTADADSVDAAEIITATFGSKTTQFNVQLLGVNMQVSANPDSIQADGNSTTNISVQLKLSTSGQVIPNATLYLNSTLGSILSTVVTNTLGSASAELLSEPQAGVAQVSIIYGGITKTVPVIFAAEKPTSILLTAEPNFIWVKESGNLEQAKLSAQVLSQTGSPVSSNVSVRFRILSGPGGGEEIFPAEMGSSTVSVPIKTVNGVAEATLRSGTRSGTVRVQVEVVNGDFNIASRITNIVIRSGPPYIYINPNDANNVESHLSLAVDYLNQDGWHNVREYGFTIYVGDRYNNPVEEGTTVYLTSTAGIITTDVKTDAMGIGSAKLLSANPKPLLNPGDPYVIAPHRIPNPNDENIMLPIQAPDYEFSEVTNSMGTLGENDGIAYILATTRGCDQNYYQNNDSEPSVNVFDVGSVIFSGPLQRFDVLYDKTTLGWNEWMSIEVIVYDINGNPVAKGSKLSATTSKGKLSATKLMPDAEDYGTGRTHFPITLLNNLDPIDDEPGNAEVTISLESPNGNATATFFVNMTFEGYGE